MPRRRKAPANLQRLGPRLPETPPETPPQTPLINRIGYIYSQKRGEPQISFSVRVLKAVSEYTQVRSSTNSVSAWFRRFVRYVEAFIFQFAGPLSLVLMVDQSVTAVAGFFSTRTL